MSSFSHRCSCRVMRATDCKWQGHNSSRWLATNECSSKAAAQRCSRVTRCNGTSIAVRRPVSGNARKVAAFLSLVALGWATGVDAVTTQIKGNSEAFQYSKHSGQLDRSELIPAPLRPGGMPDLKATVGQLFQYRLGYYSLEASPVGYKVSPIIIKHVDT